LKDQEVEEILTSQKRNQFKKQKLKEKSANLYLEEPLMGATSQPFSCRKHLFSKARMHLT